MRGIYRNEPVVYMMEENVRGFGNGAPKGAGNKMYKREKNNMNKKG